MRVEVRLFAAAQQAVQRPMIQVDIPDAATIGDLRKAIRAQFPEVEPTARHSLFAVNNEYADDSTLIPPGAEIACIPPVSGG